MVELPTPPSEAASVSVATSTASEDLNSATTHGPIPHGAMDSGAGNSAVGPMEEDDDELWDLVLKDDEEDMEDMEGVSRDNMPTEYLSVDGCNLTSPVLRDILSTTAVEGANESLGQTSVMMTCDAQKKRNSDRRLELNIDVEF